MDDGEEKTTAYTIDPNPNDIIEEELAAHTMHDYLGVLDKHWKELTEDLWLLQWTHEMGTNEWNPTGRWFHEWLMKSGDHAACSFGRCLGIVYCPINNNPWQTVFSANHKDVWKSQHAPWTDVEVYAWENIELIRTWLSKQEYWLNPTTEKHCYLIKG